MKTFQPDYRHLQEAAWNRQPQRLPLYEHQINLSRIEAVLNRPLQEIWEDGGMHEFYRHYCDFFLKMGYDTVSFEECLCNVLPGGGALGGHKQGIIRDRADFERYPWDEIPQLYITRNQPRFAAMREVLPPGMLIVGGVGNGIFECVQDLTGYMDLCYISADDPELYRDLFARVASVITQIWGWFLAEFADLCAVCRIGDDLGFKSNTLISTADINTHILPAYKKIVDLVHDCQKPFLLHSCGNLLDVMDDIIRVTGINAKHSNEDQIAPFHVWVERFGDRIGNFGGIDTGELCRLSKPEMREYIHTLIRRCEGHGGFAFSSGNSIPDYVPIEGYLNMIEIVREYRDE